MATDVMTPEICRVGHVRQDTYDTFTLGLEFPEGNRNWTFLPGQFNMLYAHGVGEAPISLSGHPRKRGQAIHTIRAVGNVSRVLCGMQAGQPLGVRGPFGAGWPMDKAWNRDVLVVAGGIGLAPLRPALYHLMDHRGHFGRITLLYGARTPKDILFNEELQAWKDSGVFHVRATVDHADEDWHGNVDVVTRLISSKDFDTQNVSVYICGPEIMMHFTLACLDEMDVDRRRVFISMERNMKCAVGFCGHCQFGTRFICKDGPVFAYDDIKDLFDKRGS